MSRFSLNHYFRCLHSVFIVYYTSNQYLWVLQVLWWSKPQVPPIFRPRSHHLGPPSVKPIVLANLLLSIFSSFLFFYYLSSKSHFLSSKSHSFLQSASFLFSIFFQRRSFFSSEAIFFLHAFFCIFYLFVALSCVLVEYVAAHILVLIYLLVSVASYFLHSSSLFLCAVYFLFFFLKLLSIASCSYCFKRLFYSVASCLQSHLIFNRIFASIASRL